MAEAVGKRPTSNVQCPTSDVRSLMLFLRLKEVCMAKIKKFEDIESWKKARKLADEVYKATSTGGFARDYGLSDQMRRAAVSILSNIAEGFERGGDKEFLQFLAVAKGSCGEVRAQLYVALDQGYLSVDDFETLSTEARAVSELLAGFIKYLRESSLRGNKYR